VQSSSQIITNKSTPSFFTGRMPFQSPNHQCQGTEGKTGSEPGLQNLAPAIAKGYSLKNLCGYLEI